MTRLSMLFVFTAFLVTSANAGDVLRLSNGNVRLDSASKGVSTGIISTNKIGYYVIQFKNRITENLKADLNKMGLEIRLRLRTEKKMY